MTDHNPNSTPKVRIVDTHEIQMARAQTFRAAKCAMEIHKMLNQVDNLESWMQSKITLAADYLESVSSNLEYDIVSAVMDVDPASMMDMNQPPVQITMPLTSADIMEQNAVKQAEQDGYAVAAATTTNANGKPQNPHRPGSPEHRAWQTAHDNASRKTTGIVPGPR
jgi:hypothetical protein